jgi:sulfur carrier protein ThiS
MKVKVILHSVLRQKLPPETRGRTELDLPDGITVADFLAQLGIPPDVNWSINGQLKRDLDQVLQSGDEIRVFQQIAGGQN